MYVSFNIVTIVMKGYIQDKSVVMNMTSSWTNGRAVIMLDTVQKCIWLSRDSGYVVSFMFVSLIVGV